MRRAAKTATVEDNVTRVHDFALTDRQLKLTSKNTAQQHCLSPKRWSFGSVDEAWIHWYKLETMN